MLGVSRLVFWPALVLICTLSLTACPAKGPAMLASGRGPARAMLAAPATMFLGNIKVCSVDRWCWENPMPQGNDLLAVWARGTRQICAVGRDGTALHYTGNAWRREQTHVHRDLFAVWGPTMLASSRRGPPMLASGRRGPSIAASSEAENFVAVGARGTLLYFRNGRWQWGDSGTEADLYAVWGPSNKEVFAAGAAGTLVRCTTKTGCTALASGSRARLRAIGGAAKALWVAGDGGVVLFRPAGSECFRRLPGAGKHDWLAIAPAAQAGEMLLAARDALVVCDAKRCRPSIPPRPGELEALLSVRLSSGTRTVIAVVQQKATAKGLASSEIVQAVTFSAGGPLGWRALWRFRGPRLHALTHAGPMGIVSVGDNGVLLRQNKKGWTQAMPIGPTGRINALWGRSSTDLYAAGAGGTVLHHDGRSWERLKISTKLELHALAPGSAGFVLAAGENGLLFACDQRRCTRQASPTTKTIHGLFSTKDRVVAVGAGGIFERRNHRWRHIRWPLRRVAAAAAPPKTLRAVWGTESGDAIYMAGDGGSLLVLRGGRLRALASGTKRALFSLHGDGKGGVLVAGDGVLLSCRSDRCRALAPAPTSSPPGRASAPAKTIQAPALRAVWAGRELGPAGSSRRIGIYVTGMAGRVLHFDGSRWHTQRTGYAGLLRALWGDESGHVFAAGDGGALLHHVPASATRPADKSGIAPTLAPSKTGRLEQNDSSAR